MGSFSSFEEILKWFNPPFHNKKVFYIKFGHKMLYANTTNTALTVCSYSTSHHPKLIIIGWVEMKID